MLKMDTPLSLSSDIGGKKIYQFSSLQQNTNPRHIPNSQERNGGEEELARLLFFLLILHHSTMFMKMFLYFVVLT